MRSRSFQCLQIRDESSQVRICEIITRHLSTRLDLLRIGDPFGQILGSMLDHTRAECLTASEVAERGSCLGLRSRTLDGMAVCARHALKKPCAACSVTPGRSRCGRLFLAQPRVELSRWLRDDANKHPGVLQSTKLGAGTTI